MSDLVEVLTPLMEEDYDPEEEMVETTAEESSGNNVRLILNKAKNLILPSMIIGAASPYILGPNTSPLGVFGAILSGGSLLLLNSLREEPVDRKLDRMFENRKLLVVSRDGSVEKPKLIDKVKEHYGYRLQYKMPLGLSDEEIYRMYRGIEVGLNAEIEIYTEDGYIFMKIYTHSLPRVLWWTRNRQEEFRNQDFTEQTAGMTLPVLIGQSRAGYEFIDIKSAPHILVAGETGGGKTNLFRVILRGLIDPLVPCIRPIIAVIDQTRKLGYIKDRAFFAGDPESTQLLINRVWLEMMYRYQIFEALGVDELDELPKKVQERFPRVVLLIDEYSALSPKMGFTQAEKESRKNTLQKLVSIIAMGRGAGVHCIIGLQRPDAQIMHDGQIKANMPVRLSFKTVDTVNSRIVLDNDMAYFLPEDIKGRCILRGKTRTRQIQILGLPHGVAKNHLKSLPEEVRSPGFTPISKPKEEIDQIEAILEKQIEPGESPETPSVLQLLRKKSKKK